MRDTYKDIEYFEAQLANGEEFLGEIRKDLNNPTDTEQGRQADLHFVFEIQLNRSLTLYNMGQPLNDVMAEMNKAWPLLITTLDFSLGNSLDVWGKKRLTPFKKSSLFPLLVLSDPPRDVAHHLFDFCKTILNYETDADCEHELDVTYDSFLEKFADYFEYRSDNVHPGVLWPQLYGRLNECFTQEEGLRSGILKAYVEGWAKLGQKDEMIYLKNEHSMKTNQEFRGYWCFLGAAVAKILKIDDSALKGHPHYPHDLVHYRSGGE